MQGKARRTVFLTKKEQKKKGEYQKMKLEKKKGTGQYKACCPWKGLDKAQVWQSLIYTSTGSLWLSIRE